MSEDIDFTEIDELMAAMDKDVKIKQSIAAEAEPKKTVVKKKAVKKQPSVVSRRPAVVKPSAKPISEQTKGDYEIIEVKSHTNKKLDDAKIEEPAVEYQPNPKTGKFMDVVHPMSDMSAETRPDRKSPPTVIASNVAAQAIIMVDPGIKPDMESESIDDGPDDTEEVSVTDDDVPEFEIEAFVEEEITVAPVELDEMPDIEPALGPDKVYGDIDMPFLENVTVEKRPLGGGDPSARAIEPSDKLTAGHSDLDPSNSHADNRVKSRKTPARTSKKHKVVSVILYVILILSIILLGVLVGAMAYLSGMLEGLF